MPQKQNIPEQKEGIKTDIVHSVSAKNREDALQIFKRAHDRLLNVNSWHKLGGKASAEFELINTNGKHAERFAQVGDYFKIDIPGPGTKSGDGYDWVKVEKIEDKTNAEGEQESILMQVRPTKNPDKNAKDTAHFLSDKATSNFIIQREKNKITASVHGRNEKPNLKSNNIIDKIRNAIIGSTAAGGVSKIQWKALVKGLLADEEN